jgi:hypothetical protein
MNLSQEEYEKYIPPFFPKNLVESALNYKPTNNDLFIASYPKCGTTWTQQVVYLLLNRGVPPNKAILFSKSIPFLEFAEPKALAPEESKTRAFKTHLPFHLVPFNQNSKYIYCMRNPKDCCVSFWFHEKGFPLLKSKTFDEFFDLFINGKTGYGDYFDHVLSWYQNKDKNNILIVHYEDMKNDFIAQLNRIATFISLDLHLELTKNKEFRENVIKFSSFEFMKQTTNNQIKKSYEMPVEELEKDEDIVDAFKDAFSVMKNEDKVYIAKEVNFIRKGIVGDYKSHLSQQQSNILNNQIFSKIGSQKDLMEKWKYLF